VLPLRFGEFTLYHAKGLNQTGKRKGKDHPKPLIYEYHHEYENSCADQKKKPIFSSTFFFFGLSMLLWHISSFSIPKVRKKPDWEGGVLDTLFTYYKCCITN
jgi:hypothetical protein